MTWTTLIVCAALLAPPGAPDEIAEEVNAGRLMQTIESLPRKRSGEGTPEHHEGLTRTRELLVERLEALGYEPELEEVFWKPIGWDEEDGPLPAWHNVIVDIEGTEAPNEVLIIGAHYDAVARAPGADDNATGVAALLEIARLMRDRPVKRSLRLIFFTLEEVGLVGSRQHAMSYRERILDETESPIGMISLDMLGFFSDEPGSQVSPIKSVEGLFEAPTVADFIGMATILAYQDFGRRVDREMRAGSPDLKTVLVDFAPIPIPDLARSDHASFWMIGVPAMIISDTANFRNPNYHRATDTIETIDVERYTDVVKGLVHAAYMIAEPVDQDDAPSDRP